MRSWKDWFADEVEQRREIARRSKRGFGFVMTDDGPHEMRGPILPRGDSFFLEGRRK